MSLKNKLFKEVLKMSSAAAQQASTKAPSHKLSCWTQPNPWVNPTHGQHWRDKLATVVGRSWQLVP